MIIDWELSARGLPWIRIGDAQVDVRATNDGYITFNRAKGERTTDHLVDRGILVTYGSDGRVEFLECVRPARPHVNGFELLGRPIEDVRLDLNAHGLKLAEDSKVLGGVVHELGLRIYAPAGVIESVAVGI